MNTLMQMTPMVMVDGNGGPPPPMMHHHHQFPHASQQAVQQQQQQPPPQQPPLSSSMNRSQRCGVCRGCQCKPCGQCTYCQDSPQFGGPGVKKQSCIERRCLRVLENRLQRDAPTFKARVGCNQCEDCRQNDCQVCLVCLDKRFFENRYMRGAMCAKKRCNNATSIELPPVPQAPVHDYQQHQRQAVKRSYEQMTPQMQQHFDMKRRVEMQYMSGMPQQQNNGMNMAQPGVLTHHQMPPQQQQQQQQPPQQQQPQNQPQNQQIQQNGQQMNQEMVQQQQQQQQQRMMIPVAYSDVLRMDQMQPGVMINQGPMIVQQQQQPQQVQQQPQQQGGQPNQPMDVPSYIIPTFMHSNTHMEFYPTKVYALEDFEQNGDPFVPPSYAPDMKNAVVLQPL